MEGLRFIVLILALTGVQAGSRSLLGSDTKPSLASLGLTDPLVPFAECFEELQHPIETYYSFVYWEFVDNDGGNAAQRHAKEDVQELIDAYYAVMQTPLLVLSNTMDPATPNVHVLHYNTSCFLSYDLPAAMAHVDQGHEGESIPVVRDGATFRMSGHASILGEGDIVRVAFNYLYDLLYHDIDILWLQPETLLSRPQHVIMHHPKQVKTNMKDMALNGMFNLYNTDLLECILAPMPSFDLVEKLTGKRPVRGENTHNEFGAMRMNACMDGLQIELVPFDSQKVYERPLPKSAQIYGLDTTYYLCRNQRYKGWRKYSNMETADSKCLPPLELMNSCESLHLSSKRVLVAQPSGSKRCVLLDLVLYHAQPTWAASDSTYTVVLHDLPWLARKDQDFTRIDDTNVAATFQGEEDGVEAKTTAVVQKVEADVSPEDELLIHLRTSDIVRNHNGEQNYSLPMPNVFSSYNKGGTPSLYSDKYHLLFCAIPKAGSTKMKQLYNCMDNGSRCHNENLASFHTKKAYDDTTVEFPDNFSLEKLEGIFNNDNIHKIVVVRHPLTKLLSAYLMFHDQTRPAPMIPGKTNSKVTFEEFVTYLQTQTNHRGDWNQHWKPQFLQCQFDYLFGAYKVIRFESLVTQVVELFESDPVLKPHLPTVQEVFATEFGHAEHADKRYEQYYTTRELKEAVATLFAEDMVLFGYTISELDAQVGA